jgi:hypothetical protein
MPGAWRMLTGPAVAALLAGCAATGAPRTTRLADADLTQAVLAVRDDLAGSRFLRERDASSPAARLVVRRVENLSSDRITRAEQWSLVSRLIADPSLRSLLASRNVTVQLPPEQVAMMERAGTPFPDLAPEDRPTHALGATIHSATRAGPRTPGAAAADVRKEYYLVSFEITEVGSRELLWQGAFEVAREAEGTIVD